MLAVRYKFSGSVEFWEEGHLVAEYFDDGWVRLLFDTCEYIFSAWDDEELFFRESGIPPVYPLGTARLGTLWNRHVEEILVPPSFGGDPGEIGADEVRFGEYRTQAFKDGQWELVAHYEAPYEDRSQYAILINGKTYHATREKLRLGRSYTVIMKGDLPVARVKEGFFKAGVYFDTNLAQSEKVFLTFMAKVGSVYNEPRRGGKLRDRGWESSRNYGKKTTA